MMDRPELATRYLLLRRPIDSDIEQIVAIVGDWEVARRLSRVPHPYGSADAMFFLEKVVPTEWVWGITVQGTDELIGVIGLTPAGAEAAELGYWLAPAYWGRGITSEAAQRVVSYAFDSLGLRYLTASFFEDNPASGRVLEKLGFVETGRAMHSCLATGCEAPSVEMRLSNVLASAWTASSP